MSTSSMASVKVVLPKTAPSVEYLCAGFPMALVKGLTESVAAPALRTEASEKNRTGRWALAKFLMENIGLVVKKKVVRT